MCLTLAGVATCIQKSALTVSMYPFAIVIIRTCDALAYHSACTEWPATVGIHPGTMILCDASTRPGVYIMMVCRSNMSQGAGRQTTASGAMYSDSDMVALPSLGTPLQTSSSINKGEREAVLIDASVRLFGSTQVAVCVWLSCMLLHLHTWAGFFIIVCIAYLHDVGIDA